MKTRALLSLLFIGAGCYNAPGINGPGGTGSGGALGNTDGGGQGGAAGGGNSGGSGGGNKGGDPGSLPCDVQALLQARCVQCHTDPPLQDVPMPMLTYADMTSAALTDPSKTVAKLSVERMKDTAKPMPPVPATPATAAEIATMEAWVSAGTPQGSCGPGSGSGNPYDTPPTCTTNRRWTGGNDGSRNMRPGGACIECHTKSGGEGPRFHFAGTVYATAHEPDDCNGAANDAGTTMSVVIVGANGRTLTLPVNSVGNFYDTNTSTGLTMPYHAKVISGGKERVMAAAQTSGDCNSCHTENGDMMAPGRIMAP